MPAIARFRQVLPHRARGPRSIALVFLAIAAALLGLDVAQPVTAVGDPTFATSFAQASPVWSDGTVLARHIPPASDPAAVEATNPDSSNATAGAVASNGSTSTEPPPPSPPVPILSRVPVTTSRAGHLWYLERFPYVRGDQTELHYRVVHQPPNAAEDSSQGATLVPRLPQAMVAVDRTLYMIFRAAEPANDAPGTSNETSGGRRSRSVTSIRAEWNPAIGRWTYEPLGRTAIVTSLPGEGELVSAVAGPLAPIVLLHQPPPREAETPAAESEPTSAAGADDELLPGMRGSHLRLLHLRLNAWQEIPLPTDLPTEEMYFRLLDGPQPMLAAQPRLLNGQGAEPTAEEVAGARTYPPITLWQLDVTAKVSEPPTWSAPVELSGVRAWLWQVESSIPFMDQTMLATFRVTTPHALSLYLLRSDIGYGVGRVAGVGSARAFVNYRGLPAVITVLTGATQEENGSNEATGSAVAATTTTPDAGAEAESSGATGASPPGSLPAPMADPHALPPDRPALELDENETVLNVRILDYTSGATIRQFTIGRRLAPGAEQFSPLALMGVLLFAFFVMFLFRPEQTGAVTSLPAGVILADPYRRFTATVIDLLPSGLLVMVALEVPMRELLIWPLFSRQVPDAVPALAMITLTVLHSTITEMISGRTLGKMLLTERVISIDGSRPRVAQVMVRNLMKFVVLLIPPVALLIFLSPMRQRLGDLAARTLVIVEVTDGNSGNTTDDDRSGDPRPPRSGRNGSDRASNGSPSASKAPEAEGNDVDATGSKTDADKGREDISRRS